MKKKSLAPRPVPTQPAPVERSTSLEFDSPHSLECTIQHALAIDSDVSLSSVVIHRTKNGVCLEGVLEFDDECPDICNRIKALTGVEEVINHLMMKKRIPLPPKG